ncbi:hypothetical protein E1286_05060 [Nonomuraea terrae]|uniref:Uncharacterized protein n=1 Tax=Nonomuraea terrae TaxID=2530383 RepID=A0A4R4Z8M9_9ACTN|nr:hypothetical protein [Nonomuraea terrae]TDD54563.1 hypothetical protein E1286_05060 [Nonomuraea terrae]
MTLDTRVYVHDEIAYKDVWLKCNQLIGTKENTRFRDEQDKTWRNGESFVEPGNAWSIGNLAGQGLCALLDISYRPGAPLRTAEQAAAHDEDICNLPESSWYDAESGPCDGSDHRPACWLEVSFDTTYGYKGDNGEGCGDLHARLVAELGQWLDGRGVRWTWVNEFTGEVHSGYERLIDLCSGGFEATAWFRTSVLPAIEAHARPS